MGLCKAGTGADVPDPQPTFPPDENYPDERNETLDLSFNYFMGNKAEAVNSVMILGYFNLNFLLSLFKVKY